MPRRLSIRYLRCPLTQVILRCYYDHMKKVDIKLGYSCNNNCIHCVAQDFKDTCLATGLPEDLSTEKFEMEMEESRSRGYDLIVFTGGEPTIRKDVLYLLRKARDLGFSLQMQTNGRRFSDMDFVQRMLSIGPMSICIALHAHNAETHDSITRVPGSFDETVAGIRNLVSMGKSPSAKTVISRLNCRLLPQIVKFMITLGVHHISLTFPHGCGNARKFYLDIVPRYNEVASYAISALRTIRDHKISADTEAFPFCILPEFEEYASEIFQAESETTLLKQYGDTEHERDWETARKVMKRKFIQCSECKYDLICEGPWAEYPENYGTEEFCPVPGEKFKSFRELKKRACDCGQQVLVLEPLPFFSSC